MGEVETSKREETKPASITRSNPPRWLVAVLVALALGTGYLALAQYQARTDLEARWQEATHQLTEVEGRAATLETQYANLRSDVTTTAEKLGVTESQLAQARAQSRRLREEQKQAAEKLSSTLQAHESQLSAISGEVTGVKGAVDETRQGLEDTRGQLDRAAGDLGVMSGEIARNRDELGELKRRGERDYFDIDLHKSKQFARVGTVSMRLQKTDAKRNKYTLTLLVNDKVIEKKDKTLLEPVQFYTQGRGQLLEVVVFDVRKDHIVGYLSAPKETVASTQPRGELP